MRIIAGVNRKGGSAKTTTSVNWATSLTEKLKVLLLDADPQGSATWWAERGEHDFELVNRANTIYF